VNKQVAVIHACFCFAAIGFFCILEAITPPFLSVLFRVVDYVYMAYGVASKGYSKKLFNSYIFYNMPSSHATTAELIISSEK
jgi:hypothetical protein